MCLFTARIHLVIKTCLIPFLICAHASAGLVAELYKYYTIEVVHTGSMTQVVCAAGIYILQKIRNYANLKILNAKTLPKLNIGLFLNLVSITDTT